MSDKRLMDQWYWPVRLLRWEDMEARRHWNLENDATRRLGLIRRKDA